VSSLSAVSPNGIELLYRADNATKIRRFARKKFPQINM
jgi:hypothetical protein